MTILSARGFLLPCSHIGWHTASRLEFSVAKSVHEPSVPWLFLSFLFGSTLCCIASDGRPQIFSSFFSSPLLYRLVFYLGFPLASETACIPSIPFVPILSYCMYKNCTLRSSLCTSRQSLQIPDVLSIVRASTPPCPPHAIVDIL